METLFIADDEQNIREGLKVILDWEALGFTLCGEAGNGEEALQKILELNPSLTLLDVRMPKLNGTEVIKKAREAGFTGKVVILSGYSDFSYAQQAIQSDVRFYITKPLDEDELLDAVQIIKTELDRKREQNNSLVQLKFKAKEVYLRELVDGVNPVSLSEADRELLQLSAGSFQAVITEGFCQDNTGYISLADLLLADYARSSSYIDSFRDNSREVLLLKGTFPQKRLIDALDHFEEQPQQGSALASLFITYGPSVDSLEDIHISYEQAKECMSRRFFCPKEVHFMGYEDLPHFLDTPTGLPDFGTVSDYAERIKSCIQVYNHPLLADTLEEIRVYLVDRTSDISVIKKYYADLYGQIIEKIVRAFFSTDLKLLPMSQAIDNIQQANYLYEIIRFLSEQCTRMMESTGVPTGESIINDIIYYINHNYTSNIKLETIAPLFGYNSAYLGKIFTKTVGEPFNTFVDKKRVEAAQELLQSGNCKVYEVAEKVGYTNVDYFHKKFRKYVGETPAEYRKRFYL